MSLRRYLSRLCEGLIFPSLIRQRAVARHGLGSVDEVRVQLNMVMESSLVQSFGAVFGRVRQRKRARGEDERNKFILCPTWIQMSELAGLCSVLDLSWTATERIKLGFQRLLLFLSDRSLPSSRVYLYSHGPTPRNPCQARFSSVFQ